MIEYRKEGNVAVITINRPEARNAVNTAVARGIEDAVDQLEADDIDALLDYRRRAPHATRAHPSDDHLMPLYVALGATLGAERRPLRATRLHDGVDLGVMAMDAYRFEPAIELHTGMQ